MPNISEQRNCCICGQSYTFCSHCHDFDATESWKYLYHDEKCREIDAILRKYRGDMITKEEAKAQMSVIKPNIDDVFKCDSIAANQIKKIFDYKEKKEEEVTDKEPVSTTEEKSSVEESVAPSPKKSYQKIQYKNSKPKNQASK